MSQIAKFENKVMQYEPMPMDKRMERRLSKADKGPNRLTTIAMVGVLAAVAAIEGYNFATEPDTHIATEVVRPYDNPTTVAQRAEREFGKHADRFNVANEAQRILDHYGTIQPGEQIQVHIK